MQASELKKSIDIDGFTLDGNNAFVIWQWEWVDTNDIESDEKSTTSITVIPETPPPSSESEEDSCDAAFSIGFLQWSHTQSPSSVLVVPRTPAIKKH